MLICNFVLQWLLKDFVGWLEEWESEALNTPNLTRNQQRKRCLSEQTLDGLRITGDISLCIVHKLKFWGFVFLGFCRLDGIRMK